MRAGASSPMKLGDEKSALFCNTVDGSVSILMLLALQTRSQQNLKHTV
jgi:hypothetical protein